MKRGRSNAAPAQSPVSPVRKRLASVAGDAVANYAGAGADKYPVSMCDMVYVFEAGRLEDARPEAELY